MHPGGNIFEPGHSPWWKKEYLSAEYTLRWLSGKTWDDGELMINDDESVFSDVWTRFEALFGSLPPWSNDVLERELGIFGLPQSVNRTFGDGKMDELIRWLEAWIRPSYEALKTMDVQALSAAAAKMEEMVTSLSSYQEQMQQHEVFVKRFVM